MDDFSASKFSNSLFLTYSVTQWIQLVKNYWEKKFKKELETETEQLKQEITEAVKKKLDETAKDSKS